MKVSPDNRHHAQLEADVTEFLHSLGFLTASATYHDVMEPELVRVLQTRESATALSLRTRADRVAIHVDVPAEFEYECKTHLSRRYHDMTVEAYPLALHVIKARYGVRCLYAYRNPIQRHQYGFWVHDLPEIREIMIPGRWSKEQTAWFETVFADAFPGTKLRALGRRTAGSGDPFAVIDKEVLPRLPDWRDLVYDFVDSVGAQISLNGEPLRREERLALLRS